MIIPENIIYSLGTLTGKGFEAYMVGGSVRDMVMGKEPSDFDITTNALPEEITECFEGKKMVLSGMKHGTVAPIINHEAIEITTYRVDGEYKDSRRPEEVFFTRSLTEDLKRRDFTVNAMAMDKNFNIIDPYGGRADIENKVIRCVGEAEKRFSEDALRIMRGLRFSSVLGFSIEEETKNAILKLYPLLSNIAKERIFTELKKLLAGANASEVLIEYRDVLLSILPELKKISESKYIENAKRIKGEDTVLNFAILTDGLDTEDARSIFNTLKTDRGLKDEVLCLISEKDEDICDLFKMKCFLKTREAEYVSKLIDFKFLTGKADEKDRDELKALFSKASSGCTKIKDLTISGKDIMALGASGKAVGEILDKLLLMVIEEKCENHAEKLKIEAKKLVNRY